MKSEEKLIYIDRLLVRYKRRKNDESKRETRVERKKIRLSMASKRSSSSSMSSRSTSCNWPLDSSHL